MDLELSDDAHCFICGKANSNGLQLDWITEGNSTQAEYIPSRTFQGWKGIVHGGILAALLDEAMTRLAWQKYGKVVTAEFTVRFHEPARIGEKLFIKGQIEESKNRLIPAKAEIHDTHGHIIASATGKTLKTSKDASHE